MRISDLDESVGRIVKGVNTTPDVGPDEIRIQAAKFGNIVDKDGRPPTLSRKIKGNSTNVLFNLGLAEKQQFTAYEQALLEGGHSFDIRQPKVSSIMQEMMAVDFSEALGDLAPNTKIYVDMDGVLADFFGEWAKVMNVKHFSQISKQHDIGDALQTIRDTDDFWLKLPMLPQAKQLLSLIQKVKGEYYICSSPLADDPRSEPHKREWIKKNLKSFLPKDIYITHNKPQFAKNKDGSSNILIDDYGVNINAWEEAGGIGFKYKDHKFERTASAIKQAMDTPVEENRVNEAMDNPYPYTLEGPNKIGTWVGKANTPNGPLVMDFDGNESQDDFSIDFAINNRMGNEGTGDAFRIFATVIAIMNEWISKVGIERVQQFDFNADKDEHDSDGRSRLYTRYAKKLASQLGWSLRKSEVGNGSADFFSLQNPNPQTNENFADGKKKGKSRPGRVKKSGASCNGSVTDLRKRAKKASGEKAKMYHWCANMKSGKKKKK